MFSISKFFIKYGLGSPGSTTRSILKTYNYSKKFVESATINISNEDIYLDIYNYRNNLSKKFNSKGTIFDYYDYFDLSLRISGDIRILIFIIIYLEDQRFREVVNNQNVIFNLVLEVIDEIVKKKNPGLIKCDYKDYRQRTYYFKEMNPYL